MAKINKHKQSDRAPKKRQRLQRIVPPADVVWLSKAQACGHLGVSRSVIDKHLDEIGFVFIGDRRVVHRSRLDEWAMARTRRQRDDGERRERAAAD